MYLCSIILRVKCLMVVKVQCLKRKLCQSKIHLSLSFSVGLGRWETLNGLFCCKAVVKLFCFQIAVCLKKLVNWDQCVHQNNVLLQHLVKEIENKCADFHSNKGNTLCAFIDWRVLQDDQASITCICLTHCFYVSRNEYK